MLLFEALDEPAGDQVRGPSAGRPGREEADTRTEALERELMRVRHDYQGAMEELESSNEELRSSNEELQSTNEELESSREELQSLNEELNTVNSELHTKIAELNESYSAITRVLNATRIAVVFLDTDLCVRRFTKEATRLINLIASDVGRPIRHIATNLNSENLVRKTEQVLRQLTPFEGEVQTRDGHWYRMAIMVHRSQDQIEGVVLTFVNIDVQKNAQRQIEAMKAREVRSAWQFADSVIDTMRESLLVMDARMRVVTANRRFYDTFGSRAEQTEGRSLFELHDGAWDVAALRRALAEITQNRRSFEDLPIEQQFQSIGGKRLLLNGRRLDTGETRGARILLAIEDITPKSTPAAKGGP